MNMEKNYNISYLSEPARCKSEVFRYQRILPRERRKGTPFALRTTIDIRPHFIYKIIIREGTNICTSWNSQTPLR